MSEQGRERGKGQRICGGLCAHGREPNAGLELANHEIMRSSQTLGWLSHPGAPTIIIILRIMVNCHCGGPDEHISPYLCPCVIPSHINCGLGLSVLWVKKKKKKKERKKCRESNAKPVSRLDFNLSGSFCFLPLGMLTLGTVLLGTQPPCYEAVQVATWRGPHGEEPRPPDDSPNWTPSQAPSDSRCPGIPDISVSAELLVQPSDCSS